MTFLELTVLLRLYRAAPPDLRRWADRQLPELREAAKLTEGARVVHQISSVRELPQDNHYRAWCSCGCQWEGSDKEVERMSMEHVRNI